MNKLKKEFINQINKSEKYVLTTLMLNLEERVCLIHDIDGSWGYLPISSQEKDDILKMEHYYEVDRYYHEKIIPKITEFKNKGMYRG